MSQNNPQKENFIGRFVNTIIQGDTLEMLKTFPDECVDCIITSPPYWGLRDYGVEGQIGLEKTPEEFVEKLVSIFREARRVLKNTGTLWLNLGDSYNSHSTGNGNVGGIEGKRKNKIDNTANTHRGKTGLKDKDLVGIPWRVAFALQQDGWYLRQDIIWCLSGGTYVYAKTQKGVAPTMIKDLARLTPSSIQLWNGEQWTKVLAISRIRRKGDEIELRLRSGERISCTPTHKFPTQKGLLEAKDIKKGDRLINKGLPETENPKNCVLDEDAAWFAGLYVAEGSRSRQCIQIAGHSNETARWDRLQKIAKKYGGYIARTVDGNNMEIRLYGKILNAIIDELVSGKTAKDKGFATTVWQYSNAFIKSMLQGYLEGDGHWENENRRWRLGFTRNYNLERDLRTACARLGYRITLKLSNVKYKGILRPTFRGEIRMTDSGHLNDKIRSEVVAIHKARCRNVYNIEVADEPHLFALASGILTHNSKPNPMPESVKDRCTKSHEYVFLMSKSTKYYFNTIEIMEPSVTQENRPDGIVRDRIYDYDSKLAVIQKRKRKNGVGIDEGKGRGGEYGFNCGVRAFRNKRSVWTIATKPFKEAHFATFPEDLVLPMIKAGCPDGGIVLDPFMGAGTTAVVAKKLGRNYIGIELNRDYIEIARKRIDHTPNPLIY